MVKISMCRRSSGGESASSDEYRYRTVDTRNRTAAGGDGDDCVEHHRRVLVCGGAVVELADGPGAQHRGQRHPDLPCDSTAGFVHGAPDVFWFGGRICRVGGGCVVGGRDADPGLLARWWTDALAVAHLDAIGVGGRGRAIWLHRIASG